MRKNTISNLLRKALQKNGIAVEIDVRRIGQLSTTVLLHVMKEAVVVHGYRVKRTFVIMVSSRSDFALRRNCEGVFQNACAVSLSYTELSESKHRR